MQCAMGLFSCRARAYRSFSFLSSDSQSLYVHLIKLIKITQRMHTGDPVNLNRPCQNPRCQKRLKRAKRKNLCGDDQRHASSLTIHTRVRSAKDPCHNATDNPGY